MTDMSRREPLPRGLRGAPRWNAARPSARQLAACLLAWLALAGCDLRTTLDEGPVKPIYDETTGKLRELQYDSNGNGTIDIRTFMDGNRPVQSEIDADEDGVVERWEYYRADGSVEKVGTSSLNDGNEDIRTFPGPDGQVTRIERSTHRDGTFNRTELLEHGVVVRAEEDSNGDGRPDRWESYQGGTLSVLALDTTLARGRPNRRLVYGPGGEMLRIEVDTKGDGTFEAAPNKTRH